MHRALDSAPYSTNGEGVEMAIHVPEGSAKLSWLLGVPINLTQRLCGFSLGQTVLEVFVHDLVYNYTVESPPPFPLPPPWPPPNPSPPSSPPPQPAQAPLPGAVGRRLMASPAQGSRPSVLDGTGALRGPSVLDG
ncbi:hypothetical protein CYMTET_13989 [Cymbomonas tetramitiformis]|uniref:Uncharacterized protein n=1 Tax=Cymbomonas tetramitiformis TaxID=36881 RepID=A0AAE0LAN2_9CHLO|nr:hypothetical protein CYMTET_13989 [Cymbomonas tetramitiformis]